MLGLFANLVKSKQSLLEFLVRWFLHLFDHEEVHHLHQQSSLSMDPDPSLILTNDIQP